MTQAIEGATLGVLRLALDAASLRHQVIAHNIANANTPGYTPAKISFESQFDAVRAALSQSRPVDARLLEDVQPVALQQQSADGTGAKVAVDMEVADLAQNTVHYQALLKGVARYLSILSIAVTEGKR